MPKGIYKHKKGINTPGFIDGRCSKIYYCIEKDCKNKISYSNWCTGNKRCAACAKKGKRNFMFGKIRSLKWKKEQSKRLSGENHPNYGKKLLEHSKRMSGKNHPMFGKKRPEHSKLMKTIVKRWANKKRPGMSKLWGNKTWKEKTLKSSMLGRLVTPNKPETLLFKLFKKLKLPYKFVGDGKVILGGFCPDFIDKKNKKIIEFNGTYWHSSKEAITKDKRKSIEYKKLGYKTLVIWEKELKNINKLNNKLKVFNAK